MPDIQQFEDASADLLRLVIETGQIGVWKLDLATSEAWRNLRHDEIFGYKEPPSEWTYAMFLDHVVDDDRERVDALQRAAIEEQRDWLFECRIRRADGRVRWISAAGRPLFDEKGSVTSLIGNVIDITRTKHNEDRLSIVTQELNHRIRNMLATIKAMISFSARGATDVDTLVENLTGRVEALARTHALLVCDGDRELTLVELLRGELETFGRLESRVTIKASQDIRLAKSQVQPMALVFHELLTNAIKHGALSNEEGRISIEVEQDSNELHIAWIESGGPPLGRIDRQGFGTRVIQGSLGSLGSVDMKFLPTGLVSKITLTKGPSE